MLEHRAEVAEREVSGCRGRRETSEIAMDDVCDIFGKGVSQSSPVREALRDHWQHLHFLPFQLAR